MTSDVAVAAAARAFEAAAFRVTLGVLVALTTWWIASWARRWFARATARSRADANVRLLAGRLIFGGILAMGLIWTLDLLGLDQPGILATFGAAGLALSLAAQDILKSFFAGLYLLFERPFLLGDEIQVRDHIGRVDEVGFRATVLRTAENELVVVPNAVIFAEIISNRSRRIPEPPGEEST